MSKAKKLIVANWKMNPETYGKAEELFLEIKEAARPISKVDIVIAPPAIYLGELASLYSGSRIAFAGQDAFWEKKGAHTGEISLPMLKDSGATHVIVGHSERRARGESDEDVNKKVLAAVGAGSIVILCIGESDRDHRSGHHLEFLTKQISSALRGVPQNKLSRIVVAYEPIWAIGKSEEEAMQPAELHETVLIIKKNIAQLYGKAAALKMRILYGGSTGPKNTERLLAEGEVDGLLVGKASLSSKEFAEMLQIAQRIS